MGCKVSVDNTVLVWDSLENNMRVKKEVYLQVVGNKGSVFLEVGPVYVTDFIELPDAEKTLRTMLSQTLVNTQVQQSP